MKAWIWIAKVVMTTSPSLLLCLRRAFTTPRFPSAWKRLLAVTSQICEERVLHSRYWRRVEKKKSQMKDSHEVSVMKISKGRDTGPNLRTCILVCVFLSSFFFSALLFLPTPGDLQYYTALWPRNKLTIASSGISYPHSNFGYPVPSVDPQRHVSKYQFLVPQ